MSASPAGKDVHQTMSDLTVNAVEPSPTTSMSTPAASPSSGAKTPPHTGIAPQNPFDNNVHNITTGISSEDSTSTVQDSFSIAMSADEIRAPGSPTRAISQEESSLPSPRMKESSAPSTPNQRVSSGIPQSAPPALISSPVSSLQPILHSYPASERRPQPSSDVRHYPRPQQPVFDDDENTEPSSAATGNTSDLTGSTEPQKKEKNSFLRLVNYTKRRIGSGKESDDEDDVMDGAVISSYLQKLGRNGKWQTRWFETDGECLSYYKSRKRTKLLATLDLEKVGDIVFDESDQKGQSFNIQVLGRLYYLRAESKSLCNDWVIGLNRVKEARMQQGNVKLVEHGFRPVDLLDANQDNSAPRVVVVANRERTRAVDETQEWDRIMVPNKEAPDGPAGPEYQETKRISTLGTVVLARWSKRKTTLTRLSAKLARWARSMRKFGCTQADSAVELDHHVHPPGHDYKSSRKSGHRSGQTGGTGSKIDDLWIGKDPARLEVDGSVPSDKPHNLHRGVSTASEESNPRYLS